MKKNNLAKLPGIIVVFLCLSLIFCGCAVRRPLDISGYSTLIFSGKTYLPLIQVCRKEGINWDYDVIARAVLLTKKDNQVRLLVDSRVVLVNGRSVTLKYPVRLREGRVLVPVDFKRVALSGFLGPKAAVRKAKKSYYRIRKVCLDAGHGGKDPGATGKRYGLFEKSVNLDIVKRMKKELESAGIDVVMTRDSDVLIPLATRADIANKAGADLFISVHSNANRSRNLSGFEVYYASESLDDISRALVLTKDSNSLERPQAGVYFGDNSLNGISNDTRAIVWDLVLGENRLESIDLADRICKLCSQDVGVKILGVKSAKYAVLKRTQMPAVLVEVGFISNAREEKYLKNPFYRQQIAEALVSGILSYKRYVEGRN